MTVQYPVSPPGSFNFSQPQEWPKWIRRFERFRIAAELIAKDEKAQVSMPIYTMGDEADDILRSFKLSDAGAKKYSVVKEKFEDHFIKKRNERARFNSCKQEKGEHVDSFITDLHALGEHCDYKDLHDEMIRDRIVVGLRDTALLENLQLDSKLTLKKAVTTARQAETVRKQQAIVQGDERKPEAPIGAVHHGQGGRRKSPQGPRWGGAMTQRRNPSQPMCYKCGHTPAHDRQQCPAKDAVCNKCRKRGHFK